VLSLYVIAGALGLAALLIVRAPVGVANWAFGLLLLVGLAALVVFERIEPRLSGDPQLVLIPGGEGLVEAVQAAGRLSREVVLLLAPRWQGGQVRPSRDEVIEAVSLLAEHPAAARPFLQRALGDDWWQGFSQLNRALRLTGSVYLLMDEPLAELPAPSQSFALAGRGTPEAIAAMTRARLTLLGPGDPQVNLVPALVAPGVRAALLASRGLRLWAGSEADRALLEAWLGEATPAAPPARWESDMQARLLSQAAGQVKTHAG
jgi:hypothetical protein